MIWPRNGSADGSGEVRYTSPATVNSAVEPAIAIASTSRRLIPARLGLATATGFCTPDFALIASASACEITRRPALRGSDMHALLNCSGVMGTPNRQLRYWDKLRLS